MFSSNLKVILLLLKFNDLFMGSTLRREGGRTSFSPPDGIIILAQLDRMIIIAINTLTFI
jgi:hypothetical protein